MREDLLGYLLEALEPSQRQSVEQALIHDDRLQRDLHLLRRSLEPLWSDKGHLDPPQGLASRTLEYIAAHTVTTPAGKSPSHTPAVLAPVTTAPGRWSMADLVVAAGIFLAASMLLFPALSQSRYSARLAACQNNLRQIGLALTNYSELHNGDFPEVAREGNLAAAGVYATKLQASGLLPDAQLVVCPASELAERAEPFSVPTVEQLENARGDGLSKLHRVVGGSYGYNLGYVSDGRYFPTKNLRRPRFPILADAPSEQLVRHQSTNHGGCGQNVWCEDGSVMYITGCKSNDSDQDIFANDQGEVAAGLHPEDAVIGPSPAKPLRTPITLDR